MKRYAHVAFALFVLAGILAGCGGETATTDQTASSTDSSGAGDTLAGYDAMATDGAHETEALEALPVLVKNQKNSGAWTDVDWGAIEAAEPVMVAYVVRVDLGDQVALFEVHADGIAHNVYWYQHPFDSGSIIWTPVAEAQSITQAPASAGETQAAAAVEAAMLDAFPDSPFTVSIQAYRFAYLLEGADPIVFEVGADGRLFSASK
jgi:hypothetical protein